MQYRASTVAELAPIARDIIDGSSNCPIILLNAEMGMGKTTLVKAVLAELGHHDTSSPTFSIVNRYDTNEGPWYHFDLYRIEQGEELEDIGFSEYLDSGRPCLIEWPQLARPFIDGPYAEISISLDEETRVITLVRH